MDDDIYIVYVAEKKDRQRRYIILSSTWSRTKRLIGCFTLFFLRLFFEPNCIAVKKKNGKTDTSTTLSYFTHYIAESSM